MQSCLHKTAFLSDRQGQKQVAICQKSDYAIVLLTKQPHIQRVRWGDQTNAYYRGSLAGRELPGIVAQRAAFGQAVDLLREILRMIADALQRLGGEKDIEICLPGWTVRLG